MNDTVPTSDDMSQVSVCLCVFFEHRGSVNFELGLSESSCASTGEHAERSASWIRCLKSQDFVFTSVLFNCVFLLVRDWCEHRDV